MTLHWERLKEIVCVALDLDGAEQSTYLDRACSGDSALRSEAERLLALGSSVHSFLTIPDAGPARSSEPPRSSAFYAGELVADRYEILDLIGSGGMGEVYRARDLRLDCKEVALKAIRAEYAGDARLERLLTRELLLAREVVHPNVCPVYDVGETGSGLGRVCFLSMKFLQGESLGQRLQRGPLKPEELLPLARQMAEGLNAAHSAGIIHRDLKPGNVMLAGGRAIITDFGLARPEVRKPGEVSAIQVGGTVGYMSPEQMAGEPVDNRADVYAFGALLYKSLTGETPKPAIGIDPELSMPLVPSAWQPVIRRAMHPDPKQRYASALELVSELNASPWRRPISRRTAGVIGGIAALAGAAWMAGEYSDRLRDLFSPLPSDRHVAFLPVTISSNDPLDMAVTHGLLESLTSDLGRAEQREKRYWVAPASDVTGKSIRSAEDAWRQLGANLVVQGRWTRDDSGVRLHLRLLAAPRGSMLRENTVLVSPGKLAELSDATLRSVARMLDVSVEPSEPAPAVSPRAFQLYQSAVIRLGRHDLSEIDQAIAELHQTAELEPRYPQAYAKLGVAHAIRYYHTRRPDAIEMAKRNVDRAIELNPKLSTAYYSAGVVDINIGDHQSAVRRLQRALALDPENTEALVQLARSYSKLGRLEEAEKAYIQGVHLRPNSWVAYNLLGTFYLSRANYPEAERNFRFVVESTPGNVIGLNNLAATQLALGRYREASVLLEKSVSIQPSAQAYSNLGNAFFLQERYADAAAAMQKAVDLTPSSHIRWRNLGDSLLMIPGRREDAMNAFRKAAGLVRSELKMNSDNAPLKVNLALYLAKLGEKQEALSLLRSLPSADADVNGIFREATAFELAGDRSTALGRLSAALDRGYSRDQILKARELEDLRRDPRFRRLLDQAKGQ